MTPIEERLVLGGIGVSLAALVLAVFEPRLAALLIGLICVLAVLGVISRVLEQLARRLPFHGAYETSARVTATVREVPQDIEVVCNVMASVRPKEPLPRAVMSRVRELATPRLASRHHIVLTDEMHDDRLAAVVSPAMYDVLVRPEFAPPAASLNAILDELEQL